LILVTSVLRLPLGRACLLEVVSSQVAHPSILTLAKVAEVVIIITEVPISIINSILVPLARFQTLIVEGSFIISSRANVELSGELVIRNRSLGSFQSRLIIKVGCRSLIVLVEFHTESTSLTRILH